MLAGLEEVDAGAIYIGDRDVTDVQPKRRDVAMVFQNYALYPYLTVAANIAFPLKMARVSRAERDKRVRAVAEMLGLTEYLERKPGQLSGGQRQRVAMGRAIIRQPSVYLMDEPLSNLDAQLRVQMRADIAALQDRLGVTTVYVTHDQAEAMTLGNRVAVLHNGYLQQCDTPRALYATPANSFVASFIGSPSMNLVPVALGTNGSVSLGGVEIPLPEPVRAAATAGGWNELLLGVRPGVARAGAGRDRRRDRGRRGDRRRRVSLLRRRRRRRANEARRADGDEDRPRARLAGVTPAAAGGGAPVRPGRRRPARLVAGYSLSWSRSQKSGHVHSASSAVATAPSALNCTASGSRCRSAAVEESGSVCILGS